MSESFSRSMKSRQLAPRLSPRSSTKRRHVSERLLPTTAFSKHAAARMEENGLIESHLALIFQYGVFSRARHDRTVYEIPDSPFLYLIDPRLPEVRNMVLVIADDGTVVSVYQKDSRFREGVLK